LVPIVVWILTLQMIPKAVIPPFGGFHKWGYPYG
jgi:hypothetical protein